MKNTRAIRWTGLISCFLVFSVLLVFFWTWKRIERSLPQLDGELSVSGLTAPAQIARDAAGIVTISAANRIDAARSLGVAHAQDRFFQMDLTRRHAAGELAQIFGDSALPLDRSTIGHRFRTLAQTAIENLPAEQLAEIEAYSQGVNAGLASLAAPPWEYAILRTDTRAWLPEDCILVFYAMVLELQDSRGTYERNLNTLRDVLGNPGVEFFNPLIGPADSALDGSTQKLPPPPGPEFIDLREANLLPLPELSWDRAEMPIIGSNAMALTGASTTSGAGLVAGDPHLMLTVPNTWYRASLEWPDENDGSPVHVSGVSLPGVPGIIIGSNGHIAWTFTNATIDTGDLVPVDLNQVAPEILYHHAGESLEFDEHVDIITSKDGDTEEVLSTWTIYGPIVARTAKGKSLAYKWTFHDPAAVNFDVLQLATARTVDEAVAIAGTAGMPNQNMFVADTTGATAWTLIGKVPNRFGFDGRLPVSWTFGDRGWDGFLSADQHPVLRGSADQPLWSGNQRKVSGEDLTRLGDAGYDGPERAGQIEDALLQLGSDTEPTDMLTIQLDDRGRWLERWQELLIRTLQDADVLSGTGPRGELLATVEKWNGHAASDSVAYRIIREWRFALAAETLEPIFAKSRRRDLLFKYQQFRYGEALWTLHRDEPAHLLAPAYTTWPELRLGAVDKVIADIDEQSGSLADHTWGATNRLEMLHPFAHFLPNAVAKILNMPRDPQSGDSRMPKVARPSHGASLRFAVSPGQESEGYLHLPGGQSGNPLSVFYRAGHHDWFTGKPTPFLPGETQHLLHLRP